MLPNELHLYAQPGGRYYRLYPYSISSEYFDLGADVKPLPHVEPFGRRAVLLIISVVVSALCATKNYVNILISSLMVLSFAAAHRMQLDQPAKVFIYSVSRLGVAMR
jgi:hypothetical protein